MRKLPTPPSVLPRRAAAPGRSRGWVAATMVLALSACTGMNGGDGNTNVIDGTGGASRGTGGAPGSGGAPGLGGASGLGGGPGAGGSTASGAGGSSAAGGPGGTAGAPGSGGATGAGGAPAGIGGATGAGGSSAMCTASAVSTATRPQLTATQATSDTILRYLAQTGTLGALTTDNWNPTAGLGDPAAFPGDLVVAADGSGTHRTVQAALTAATGTARRYILVRPGTYPEKVAINTATPITIYGTGPATQVTIVAAQSANDAGGTAQSATMTVRNNNFQMMNLTVSNDFATPATGTNIQAVALYTTGDRIVMQNVRLHGFQDTLYIDSPSATTVARVYIKGGFIEGDTDFIFGRSTTVIDGSTINYLSSRKGTGSGVHLAPSTSVANNYGFLVVSSTFTGDAAAPANRISLGRSWDQSSTTPTPNGQAVVRDSILGAHINRSAPWAAAATSGRAFSATGNRFFEYCNSGPGAAP